MPTYDYRCSKCEFIFEQYQKIDDREIPCKSVCPNCKEKNTVSITYTSAPSIVDPVRIGVRKPDGGFKEIISKIKEKHKGHSMNGEYT